MVAVVVSGIAGIARIARNTGSGRMVPTRLEQYADNVATPSSATSNSDNPSDGSFDNIPYDGNS